jgi:ABC-type transport system involved in cytochrome c biogenesis permease subunit
VPPTAPPDPTMAALVYATLALYGATFVVTALAPRAGRAALAVTAAVHLTALVHRGWLLGFFPLTNKMESFAAASLAVTLVALGHWRRERGYALPLVALAGVALAAATGFSLALTPPPPLMRTIWYPLHVPLAFLAYGLWAAAAAAAVIWLARREPEWLRLVDHLALQGFALWSLSMICGGVWGVLAWGAYFLWDPKVIWSVILWFHYATFVHLRLTPALRGRPGVRPALALVGFAFVLVAYVGTSFFWGRSSHAF